MPTDAHPHQHASADAARQGSRQPQRFDPARAARLDDPARFAYLPPGDLLQLLAAPHGARVLDFGAGTGLYALALALARPDLRILALDEQPEMLELLRAKLAAPAAPPNVQSLAPSDLPALRGQLPRIFALNVLHELGDAALVQLRELLAPEGRAVFIDWNRDVERPLGPPPEHVYSPREARARLERHGFQVAAAPDFAYHYTWLAMKTPCNG